MSNYLKQRWAELDRTDRIVVMFLLVCAVIDVPFIFYGSAPVTSAGDALSNTVLAFFYLEAVYWRARCIRSEVEWEAGV